LGFPTVRLDGGYKAYRHYVLDTFSRQYSFVVIGGPTGSGKTQLIYDLAKAGHQTIDLEGLANHTGSAFGLLPGVTQPSTEQFENLLAQRLASMDTARPIYIEDECRLVGLCAIPKGIYDQMDSSPVFWLDEPVASRLERSVALYGQFSKEWLKSCAEKLMKRLGGQRLTAVTTAIDEGRLHDAAAILLNYYDDAYLHSCSRHNRSITKVKREEVFSCINFPSV
jgi:tRNA 2-selenouridine synthase